MQVVNVRADSLFQAVADETRLRIVRLMATTGEEACLCELVDSLKAPDYKLSRHLKILRQAGLLSAHREGRWVYHRLVQEPLHIQKLLATVLALPDAGKAFRSDLACFKARLRLREDGRCQGTSEDAMVRAS